MVLTGYAEFKLNRQPSLKSPELVVNLAVKGNQSLNTASVGIGCFGASYMQPKILKKCRANTGCKPSES